MNGASCSSKNNFIVKAIVIFGLATIAFYLLTEHKAHLLAYSSYIFFLAYILLHFFMCGRHGGHGGHGEQGGHCGHDGEKHKHRGENKMIQQGTGGYEDTAARAQPESVQMSDFSCL